MEVIVKDGQTVVGIAGLGVESGPGVILDVDDATGQGLIESGACEVHKAAEKVVVKVKGKGKADAGDDL